MADINGETGVSVVLMSKPVQTVTPVQLQVVELPASGFQATIGQGVNAPRAGYCGVCNDLVVVDPPCVTRASVDRFECFSRRVADVPARARYDLHAWRLKRPSLADPKLPEEGSDAPHCQHW